MVSFNLIKRHLAIRARPEFKACRSLSKLVAYSQEMFLQNFGSFEEQVRNSNPDFAIKFLVTADKLAGKKRRNPESMQMDLDLITEKVFLQLLEDLGDPTVTKHSDLSLILDLISNYYTDKQETNSLLISTVEEIEKRLHFFSEDELKSMQEQIERLQVMHPKPFMLKKLQTKMKQTEIVSRLRGDFFKDLKIEEFSYDRSKDKLVVRHNECRIVFQGIQKRNADSMVHAIDLLRKERPDLIMITLAPFSNEQRDYNSPSEIDRALFHRFKGKNIFKVGQTERLVYEKVSGLKRVNTLQSILYNFSSEGAYSEHDSPISLIGASPEEISIKNSGSILQNIRAQLTLEHLNWISICINQQGCPQCSEKVDFGPEAIAPAYLDHVSSKMQKDSRPSAVANHIRERIQEGGKYVVFTHHPVFEIARAVYSPVQALTQEPFSVECRALMDDLDLEMQNPEIQQVLSSLLPDWPFEKASRDCFIEKLLIK